MNIKIIKYDDSKTNNVLLFEMLGISYTHPALKILVNKFHQRNITSNNTKYPLIIRMKLSMVEALNRIKGGDKFFRTFSQNKNGAYSFLNNSSIWIRLVDDNDDAEQKAIDEFKYFENIGLYNYDSAFENVDYNSRLQGHNYLNSPQSQGHGVHVTPVLYGDETEFLNILRENFSEIK